MIDYVNSKVSKLRSPFIINEDGTSQTRLNNHGRVGFYVERLCGIEPNSSQQPDFGSWELKTFQYGKKVSIGTMSDDEWFSIETNPTPKFEKSYPYAKMKNTIFVAYEKLDEWPKPIYVVRGTGTCQLGMLPDAMKNELQRDYEFICRVIKARSRSRDQLTRYLMDYGSVSGKYLALNYKGQGNNGYNYPAWSFSVKFMNKISTNQ